MLWTDKNLDGDALVDVCKKIIQKPLGSGALSSGRSTAGN